MPRCGLTKVACLELAEHGIRVNTVHPGVVDTPMLGKDELDDDLVQRIVAQIPIGYIADPEDVARVVLFLASDESRSVSGAEVCVDGGIMAKVNRPGVSGLAPTGATGVSVPRSPVR